MKYKLIGFILITIFTTSCQIISMEEVPSEELIRKWNTIQPFIIEKEDITGIYRNIDIDAIIFEYTTTIADENSLKKGILANLAESKWNLSPGNAQWIEFERRFSKGDRSSERPDMAIFSSAELVRIAFIPDTRRVIVGYVQADSSEKNTSFSETGESKWADKVIWPKFEEAIMKEASNK